MVLRRKEKPMITRRDVFVAQIAIAGTAAAFAIADQTPIMGSAVFDWNGSGESTSCH